MENNVRVTAAFSPLTEAEYGVLEEAVLALKLGAAILCTACRYCMDCPAGVDIPGVFSVYNHYLTGYRGMNNSWGDGVNFITDYRHVGAGGQAHCCVSCGKCAPRCPQKIDIPVPMKTIAAVAGKLGAAM